MAAMVPKTKAEEVLEQVAALLDRRGSVNELLLARLKREARSSLNADPVVAHVALGAIASLEWDDESLDRHHQAAIALEDNIVVRQNYATSLSQVDRVFDSWEQLRIASSMEPGDLAALDRAIGGAYVAGDFQAALDLCETFSKRSPGKLHESKVQIERAVNVLSARQFSREQVRDCLGAAYGVLRDERIPSSGVTVETYVEPGSPVMYHIRLPNIRRSQIEELEAKLADRMFDQVEGFDLNAFWVGYTEAETENVDGD